MLVVQDSAREVGEGTAERELRRRYDRYRRAQAGRLVRMLPRDAIRPLYRRACAAVGDGRPDDPLAVLIAYCEELLPLPPYEVWREDLELNPAAHLEDLDESAEAPTADAPSTLATRPLTAAGRSWLAKLRSFRDQGAWRGFIAFEGEGSTVVPRTGTIFCESDPAELRARFFSFEPATLEAFLRSSLP